MDPLSLAGVVAGAVSLLLLVARIAALFWQGKDVRAECFCGKSRIGINYDADGDGKITTNQVFVIDPRNRSITSRPATPSPDATVADSAPPPPLKLQQLTDKGGEQVLGKGVVDVDPPCVGAK